MTSVKDFLKQKTGFPKSVAWDNLDIGTRIGGVIVAEPEVIPQTDVNTNEDRFFVDPKSGKKTPMLQIAIVVKTKLRNPAIEDDDGTRTLYVRGGTTYESSRKNLMEALAVHGLEEPRVGDEVYLTRIANRKAAGIKGRTHQFKVEYVLGKEGVVPASSDDKDIVQEVPQSPWDE